MGRALLIPHWGEDLNYYQKVLGSNPIAYWPLGESSGSVAYELVNGWNGSYTGVTLGQSGVGDGKTCPLFDGANDYVDIYSAALIAAFDGAEGSLMVWFKAFDAAMWTDASMRVTMGFEVDVNNKVRLLSSGAGSLKFHRYGGGTAENIELEAGVADTIWRCGVLVWSEVGDYVRGYINGGLEGSSATLGNWVGNPSVSMTLIGARTVTPTNPWHGYLAHGAVWDTPLTLAQIENLAVV
jgi:hypothetical protein